MEALQVDYRNADHTASYVNTKDARKLDILAIDCTGHPECHDDPAIPERASQILFKVQRRGDAASLISYQSPSEAHTDVARLPHTSQSAGDAHLPQIPKSGDDVLLRCDDTTFVMTSSLASHDSDERSSGLQQARERAIVFGRSRSLRCTLRWVWSIPHSAHRTRASRLWT
nr:hypothetical protein CFP56_20583 [Quercus suber]